MVVQVIAQPAADSGQFWVPDDSPDSTRRAIYSPAAPIVTEDLPPPSHLDSYFNQITISSLKVISKGRHDYHWILSVKSWWAIGLLIDLSKKCENNFIDNFPFLCKITTKIINFQDLGNSLGGHLGRGWARVISSGNGFGFLTFSNRHQLLHHFLGRPPQSLLTNW